MIRLARPLLGVEEEQAVAETLRSGWLVQGPRVADFEALLAAEIGVPHVAACSSGTAALQLALAALELPAGATVALPAYTFPATINAVLLAGLTPRLLDVDPTTYNLVADDVRALLDGPADARPAVLMTVHQFGLPSPVLELSELLQERGVPLVEDAACALGSSATAPDGRVVPAGAMGALGCFSFHPRKLISTGEGGAVSTSDPALDERLRLLRNHGMQRPAGGGPIEFVVAGWNFRLSEIHAAIGIVQMERLAGLLADRARIAAGYIDRLSPLVGRGLGLPRVPAGVQPNWQSYVVLVPDDCAVPDVVASLRADGVEATIGAQPLHQQPAYRELAGCQVPLPGTEEAARRAVALPVPPSLSDDDMDTVAAALGRAFERAHQRPAGVVVAGV